jgi:hypothetical protein
LQLSQNAEAAQQAMDAATEMITPETQTADSSAQRNAE